MVRFFSITAAFLLAILCSCTVSSPQIGELRWRHRYLSDRQTASKRYSLMLYFRITDEDGPEDIEKCYVLKDDEELYWNLDGATRETRAFSGSSWTGSASLSMPDGGALPPGNYRVVVRDFSGLEASSAFFVPDKPRPSLASIKMTANTIELKNGGPEGARLVLYQSDGTVFGSVLLQEGKNHLSTIHTQLQGARQASFAVLAQTVSVQNLVILQGSYSRQELFFLNE